MNHLDPGSTAGFSIQRENEIDEICDQFELAWRSGDEPSIREFLSTTDEDLRTTLFIELVRVDVNYRVQRGERPSSRQYVNAFPEFGRLSGVIESSIAVEVRDRVPKQIGRFRLEREVGRGAFGTVWKARDLEMGRHVALKLATSIQHGSRDLKHESRAAARLDHPGIVSVYDSGEQDGLPYIVYQFIDGPTLLKWRKTHTFTPRTAAELCVEVASALAYAHSENIVHRDLKPGNILIENDIPLISDFGLARRLDAESTINAEGKIIGTLAYMSPEQARGAQDEIDGRTDIYALGVILYELMTGRQLFTGSSRDVISAIHTQEPTEPRLIKPEIPVELQTICLAAISKAPTDRYQTAVDLRDDLQRFLNGDAIVRRPDSSLAKVRRTIRRTPKAVWLVGGLLSAVIGLLLAFLPNSSPAPPPYIWSVGITTEPPGANVYIVPRDPDTGEPVFEQLAIAEGTTPLRHDMTPGRYLVTVVMPGSPARFQEVIRLVPSPGSMIGSLSYDHVRYRMTGEGKIEWSTIVMPTEDEIKAITDEMALIPAPEDSGVAPAELSRPEGIVPFYVATREFNHQDFQTLRPNGTTESTLYDGPQPLERHLVVPYDAACHWAEESRCRILSEFEYEYLALQAAEQQSPGTPAGDAVIPLQPPVRGILAPPAEWTTSFARGLEHEIEAHDPKGHWHDFRVIRGGDLNVIQGGVDQRMNLPWEPQRHPGFRWKRYTGVGFRLARSREPRVFTYLDKSENQSGPPQ